MGGRLRVRAQSVKDFGDFSSFVAVEDYYAWQGLQSRYEAAYPGDYTGNANQNEQTYYNKLAISSHFSLGTKALIGSSITQDLDIDGHAEGNVKDISYTLTLDNRPGYKDTLGEPSIALNDLKYPNNTGEFSWRIFCDYDYTRKDFTAKYDPFHFVQNGMTPGAAFLMNAALIGATGEYANENSFLSSLSS